MIGLWLIDGLFIAFVVGGLLVGHFCDLHPDENPGRDHVRN